MKSTVAVISLGAFICLTNAIGETSAGDKRDLPYLAHIKLYVRNRAIGHKVCAGTLISFSDILTARHCFFNVHRGEITLGTDDISPNSRNKIIIQFNTSTHVIQHETADLALIKLPTPLERKEGLVDVVVLPSKSDKNVTKSRRSVVYGWGPHYSWRNKVDLRYHYSVAYLIGLCDDGCSVSEEVCSINAPQDKKPCYYDAGGTVMWMPTYWDHEMVGIVTWGGRECTRRVSQRFVAIAKYLDWLQENSDAVIRP